MIKIDEIHLHNLRNGEHFELMQYIAKIITDAALVARYAEVTGLWNGMIERTENIIAACRGKEKKL